MKAGSLMVSGLLLSLGLTSLAIGTDFDWCPRLNQQAAANPNNYRLSLAERFRLTDEQVDLVLGNVAQPSDAYMLLRMGELAKQPPERLVQQYQSDKDQGWGVMARHLGIKPGSSEFHALKRGHDLRDYRPERRASKAKPARLKSTREAKRAKGSKQARSKDRRHETRSSQVESQGSNRSTHAPQHDAHATRPVTDAAPETSDH